MCLACATRQHNVPRPGQNAINRPSVCRTLCREHSGQAKPDVYIRHLSKGKAHPPILMMPTRMALLHFFSNWRRLCALRIRLAIRAIPAGYARMIIDISPLNGNIFVTCYAILDRTILNLFKLQRRQQILFDIHIWAKQRF